MIKVKTRNLYLGADLTPIFFAKTRAEFMAAVSDAYRQALNTDFRGRAEALAKEIKATEPHLIGLQEAVVWRAGPASQNPVGQVQIDFLQLILNEVNQRAPRYEICASASGVDAEAPTKAGYKVRLTLSDVILVRADLSREAKLSNIHKANYSSNLSLPTVIGPITFLRQWVSVDVSSGGKKFRFISTHLEAVAPAIPIRRAQAQELLAGPAQTPLPTILLGDFNSEPRTAGDAANDLIAAGFVDVWTEVQPAAPGYTSGQSADLRNLTATLDQRIDLILRRGGLRGVDVDTIGNSLEDRTPAGVWPSDHAGVVATLGFFD